MAPAAARQEQMTRDEAAELSRRTYQHAQARLLQACDCFNIHWNWRRYLHYGRIVTFNEYIERRIRTRRSAGVVMIVVSVPGLIVGPLKIFLGDYTNGDDFLGGLFLGTGVVVSAIGIGLTVSGVRRLHALRRIRQKLHLETRRTSSHFGLMARPEGGVFGLEARLRF